MYRLLETLLPEKSFDKTELKAISVTSAWSGEDAVK
jgi:hypothetical protein